MPNFWETKFSLFQQNLWYRLQSQRPTQKNHENYAPWKIVMKIMQIGMKIIYSSSVDRATLKAILILLPLLGLTWVFGILTIDRNTTVFAWLFTILNSTQVCVYQYGYEWMYDHHIHYNSMLSNKIQWPHVVDIKVYLTTENCMLVAIGMSPCMAHLLYMRSSCPFNNDNMKPSHIINLFIQSIHCRVL